MSKWEMVKLGDVTDVITKGTTPTTLGYEFVDDGVNFIKIESISENGAFLIDKFAHISKECNEKLKRSQLEKNDLLFSIAGALGRIAIVSEEILPANTNQALSIIRIKDKKVNLKYMQTVLRSNFIFKQFQKQKQGVAQLNLSLKNVSDLIIPLPPMEVQQKIAHTLDTVSDLIKMYKEQLEQLDVLVKSRFVEMFGDPLTNEKKWDEKKAEDVCELITDGSHFSPKGCENGYPMLSVKDMRNDGFHYDKCKYVSEEDYQTLLKQGCKPLNNDVLISKDGSCFYYGFVMKDEIEQVILSSIAILRPNTEIVESEYLCRYMLSEQIVKLVSDNYVTGAALKRVILKGIKQIPVMVPSILLQKQFVSFVNQVDKLKAEVKKALEQSEILYNALMQEYFE